MLNITKYYSYEFEGTTGREKMVLSLERWIGKVAVVTGANSGIGKVTSQKLTEEGIIVVGFDKRVEAIEANSKKLINASGKLYSYKVDVTNEEDVHNAFKWVRENVGPVSILINNAGIFANSSMLNGNVEDWKAILDVNLLGLCIMSKEAIKVMREHNIDGQIININSIAGITVIPGTHMYTASKFAGRAISEATRLELNAIKSKIKISCICPDGVNTPLMRAVSDVDDAEAERKYLTPDDITDAILYILSTPPHVQIQDIVVLKTGERETSVLNM